MIRPRVRHPLLVVTGLVLVTTGLVLTRTPPRADAPDLGPSTAVAVEATTPLAPSSTRPPAPSTPPSAPAAPQPVGAPAPVAVVIPMVADPVPLVPVGVLDAGVLQLPERPSVLGWYAAGAAPGDPDGTAVIAGHVDSAVYGAGPLELLYELGEGDVVTVTDAGGAEHSFAVTSRTSYPKSALPPEVFRTDGVHQLALITCGGEFDEATGQYAENVVVLAAPAA